MKEELIRVENERFQNNGSDCRFELSISRGECIGIYVDEHLTSGTAYLDIFKGASHVTGGRVFVCGQRTGSIEMEHWIEQHCMVADRSRFVSKELTVWDFVMALGKPLPWRQRRQAEVRLRAPETLRMLRQMELDIPWQAKLTGLSLLDYYRMAVFRAWFCGIELLVLDRFTEILRHRDLEQLMRCVQLLLERGTAVLLFDMSEEFLYRYAGRIDVIRDRCTCYRLYPDEYDGRLFEILGWDRRSRSVEHLTVPCGEQVVMDAMGLTFPGLPPLTFQIRSGEIALLRDENYNTVSRIQDCFLGGRSWVHGAFRLDGQTYTYRELMRLTGTRIGIQIERPDRPYGVLFDDLTALDNLCIGLLPKAGHHIVRRRVTETILQEASHWFSHDMLQRPLSAWTLPERLRFSYYKWYLINPRLLICFFPFAGQESAYHDMIIDMLVTCARRGMAVWLISSGIDAICEKTENREFLQRLRVL